jgi:hypothetical protein
MKVSGMMPVGNGSYRISVGAGGHEVGSVMIHDHGKAAIEVTDLAVDPAHRKQGLGGVLMASAVRAGLQLRKSTVTLASQDKGTGRLTAWYKKMGFAPTGANRHGYPVLEAPIGRALSGVAQGKVMLPTPQTKDRPRKRTDDGPHIQAQMRCSLATPTVPPSRNNPIAPLSPVKVIQRMDGGGSAAHSATATSGRDTVTVPSGGGGALKARLSGAPRRSEARKFYSMLESVENVRGGNPWHAYDCAEPNAVGALVLRGCPLGAIVVSNINQNGTPRIPCRNCRQWLYQAAGGWRVRQNIRPPRRRYQAPPMPVGNAPPQVHREPPRVSLRELGERMNVFEILNRDNTAALAEAKGIAESLGKRL